MNEIKGYILLTQSTNEPIVNSITGQIVIYPTIEGALVESNKSISHVKAVKCRVTYETI